MTSVLIIDDDDRLATPLGEYFSRYNLTLHAETHPDDGLKTLEQKHFDLVILDVMLPDKDGFEVCRLIRESSDIPVIMLTARGDITDRLKGLELGADDYLAKPFEPRELVARIQNILRRTESDTPPKALLKFENIEIDQSRQEVRVKKQSVNLTTNEYQLLVIFASHPGKKLSRDDISSIMRGSNIELFSRALDVQISRLRQKLKPTDYIKTVWGSGYQFVAPEQ